MGSPMFDFLKGGNGASLPGPLGNITNFITQFNNFRQSFQGNPEEAVNNLRQSGQMSDEMYNRIVQTASPIYKMLKGR